MKKIKIIVIGMILLLSTAIQAQDLATKEVPQSFTTGLMKVYPKATNIEWKKRGMDYKVKFEVDHLDHEIWFNKDGDRVRLEQHVVQSELPQSIIDILKRDYSDYTIDSVKKTEKKGVTTYEVEVEKGWELNQRIGFTLTGKVLSVTGE